MGCRVLGGVSWRLGRVVGSWAAGFLGVLGWVRVFWGVGIRFFVCLRCAGLVEG